MTGSELVISKLIREAEKVFERREIKEQEEKGKEKEKEKGEEKGGEDNPKFDLLVLLVHSILTTSIQFSYLGGEGVDDHAGEKDSLNTDWRIDGNYSMKYRYRQQFTYLFKAIPMDDILIVNIMLLQKPDDVQTLELKISDYIKEIANTEKPGESVRNVDQLISSIRTLLFPRESVSAPLSQSQSRRNPDLEPDTDPLRDRRPHSQPNPLGAERDFRDSQPFSIGRSDLDPFAPAGNGMFAGPNHPMFGRNPFPQPQPTIPFGVPPGARYDPIVPPGIPVPGYPSPFNPHNPQNPPNRIPGEPDPDEFGPPGFEYS